MKFNAQEQEQKQWTYFIEYWPGHIAMGSRVRGNLETVEGLTEQEFRERMKLIGRSGGYLLNYGRERSNKRNKAAA